MTAWEKKIINAFISRYSVSVPKSEVTGILRNSLRLRSVSIYPEFDTAGNDEKESYLKAVETLKRQGLVSVNWEKGGKGKRIKTLTCVNMEKFFEKAGIMEPRTKAESIRLLFREKLQTLGEVPEYSADTGKIFALLKHMAETFSSREVRWDMDLKAAEDFVSLLDIFFAPFKYRNMTTRALSVSLYNDSKRLENILGLFGPALSQAQKQGIPSPDLSFLERSFPEALIAGKIIFEYQGAALSADPETPMINAPGLILGLPPESIREIRNIKTLSAGEMPSVLTVENKETFFALGDPQNYGQEGESPVYDCFLYIGGYPNKATAAVIKLLAISGFCFYHAGDLDPDGILILQNIMDIAERPVYPVQMDASTFDRYLPQARPLNKIMLSQTAKIREDTKAIPGMAELIRRIEETGRGLEQEIIDYRI
jgi:hypothetical protein